MRVTNERQSPQLAQGGACLGLEIGELAAWIAIAYGAAGPERQWRTSFTAPPSPDEFFQRIVDGAREVCGEDEIVGVGVALWATMDSAPDVSRAGALPVDWDGVALTTRLRAIFQAPVRMRSAVDAAALAEARIGAGKDTNPLVYIHLGREVVSALVYECEPRQGAHGRAGQIGHWRIAEDGPRCACGAIGHLNPVCSSQGFVRLAIGLASRDDNALAAVTETTGGRVEALTSSRIVALAAAGVEPLRELVRLAANALGVALARLTLVVDPSVIVLGGPLGTTGGLFIEWTGERLVADLHAITGDGPVPRLVSASLEPRSALTGAWLIGKEAAME